MILKNVEKTEEKSAVLSVEIDAKEFEDALNKAYLAAKKNIAIPGFRKGKAPRQMVENMYGKEVFYQDALDEIAPSAFEFAMTESGVKMVGRPSLKDVKFGEDKVVDIDFEVALYPEVKLGEYKGLKAARKSAEVTEDDVAAEIANVQKRNARMISVDRPAEMGDTVNIDFEGFLNDEPFEGGKAEGYDLELGSNSFVPGFEEQLCGMTAGENKDINITFPENYVENLAGKDVVFKIKLNTVTYAELPELDDDFAKDVSEFDTIDEYKESVKKDLAEKKAAESDNDFRAEIMKQAIDNMEVEVPQVMIHEKASEIMRGYAANFGMNVGEMTDEQIIQTLGINEEMYNSSIVPGALVQVKSELLYEAVSEAEGLEVSEEDLEEYINKAAADVNAKPEELKSYFGEAYLKNELLRDKAIAVIIDSAVEE